MSENNRHDNHHEHVHDENCDCGHDHKHDHGHIHSEDCGCGENTAHPGEITVGHTFHDEAVIVSGAVLLYGRYDDIRETLKERLEAVSDFVSGQGGIVGHIKASASVTTVEMFSTTGDAAMIKKSPEQEIKINVVAIVFAIAPEEIDKKVFDALEDIKNKA